MDGHKKIGFLKNMENHLWFIWNISLYQRNFSLPPCDIDIDFVIFLSLYLSKLDDSTETVTVCLIWPIPAPMTDAPNLDEYMPSGSKF